MASKKRPKVGIGVLVFKNGKVLLGKRTGSHGAGEYAFPGGHLEFGESIIECAKRECLEEAGIKIKNVRFLRLYNLKKYKGKHYVDIGLTAEWKSGIPKVLEPAKIEGWRWYEFDKLPKPLFKTTRSYLQALKTGQNFFDE
ncbi:MAG: NUDIX domain-containing protein [Candidatus Daviesbacteria bacterium]|nr:NUDIX domain-containing protein [Candidatus Daviesbacteria bacterium]